MRGYVGRLLNGEGSVTAAAGIHSDSWQVYQHEVAQAASRRGCSFCRAGLPQLHSLPKLLR